MSVRHSAASCLVALALLSAACGPAGDDACDPTTLPQELRALDAEEAAFLRLLNDYRAQNGLVALTATPLLNQVAYDHSFDMAQNGFFAHNSRDGRTPFTRMEQAGYRGGYMAENIAAGYAGAADTFNQWKTSPGHNTNMLGSRYRAIGIGRAYVATSTYRYYWTTDFGDVVDSSATAPVADAGVTAPPADAGTPPRVDGGTTTPGCRGTSELESNNTSTTANLLGPATCGRLASGSDKDWFTFSLPVRGPYRVEVTSASDARIAVWQRVSGVYYAVSQSTWQRVSKTSSGAGKYLVRVSSPALRSQSYSLAFTR